MCVPPWDITDASSIRGQGDVDGQCVHHMHAIDVRICQSYVCYQHTHSITRMLQICVKGHCK
jgi:hypothetical protein